MCTAYRGPCTHTIWRAYMPDIFVFHHTVCWWKVGGELGKLRQELRWDLEAVGPRWLCTFFWSHTVYCLNGNILNLVHFTYVSHWHTHRCHSHMPMLALKHTDEAVSFPCPPSKPLAPLVYPSLWQLSVCVFVCVSIWGRRYCVSSALQG